MCGKCCSFFIVPLGDNITDDMIDWYVKHEKTSVGLRQEDGMYWLILDLRCNDLGANGECTDYDNRPEVCRAFTCGGVKSPSELFDMIWEG